MKYIWKINKKSCGYAGEDSRTETSEQIVLGCEWNHKKWMELKKDLFENREDAENYIRPIVQKAFDFLISDLSGLNEDGEDQDDLLKEYQERGLKEIRTEELRKNDPLYELYHSEEPTTIFVCPIKYEDDRIGECFATIYRMAVN